MPASAVISAPIVYLKIVAVKKPVVEKRVIKNCRYLQLQGSHSLRGEEAYK